ncbi:MAG: hypothetical protein D6705_04485 [Deltaproteobacteria bacterium]|nr:MAG: hypothetical protein D6705_04485 [Deltaproteobacteria bacterium]
MLPGNSQGPWRISGGDPETTCSWSNEAAPEHSILAAPGDPQYFVGFRRKTPEGPTDAYYNWSLPSGDWDPGLHLAPDAPDVNAASDPWTATHGGIGVDLLSYVGVPGFEVVAGGTTPASLGSGGAWTVQPRRIDRVAAMGDGPVMATDLGAPTLSVAYVSQEAQGKTIFVDRFAPCDTGDLGSDTCPYAWDTPVAVTSGSNLLGHPRIVHNPCSHRVMLLYVEIIKGLMPTFVGRVRVINAAGQVSGPKTIVSGPAVGLPECTGKGGQAPACGTNTGDCRIPGATDCWALVSHVDAATWRDPDSGQCLLYVALDTRDGPANRATVRTAVVDISDDEMTDMDILESFETTDLGTSNRDLSGTIVVDRSTGAAGVFYYRQEAGDPCDTTFRGKVRAGPGDPWQDVGPLSGHFPSMVVAPNGMADDVRGASFNRPGRLFVAWAQPVPTSDEACPTCQGARMSLAVMGMEVVP